MSISTLLTEDRRLVILRALAEDAGYSHNESVLQSILAAFGHSVSRDVVKTQINWLAEQGLVTVDTVGNYLIAKLTTRGADVAAGHATVPGVKRPGPKG
ncbi:MAG: hypothetical protein C0622_05260 [Desulfuromonas sp.]|nr:MAG: hypothetical protein C0622_05260 [Desulfuromonas sp.]